MSLEEWRRICTDCCLINENFRAKDMDITFNLSLMTQVDEINYERHLKMSYIEFVEAIARVAHISNFLVPSLYQLPSYCLPNSDAVVDFNEYEKQKREKI